ESLHSPEEIKLLIAASQEAGLLRPEQQELVSRVLKDIRQCRHEQLLVGKGSIDAPFGMILKKDLLDQIDTMAALREPLVVHEATPIFKVLEQFKKAPVRLAMISDDYGALEGIVTDRPARGHRRRPAERRGEKN